MVFEDETVKRETWDGGKPGEPRWKRWTYETTKPVAWAEVDPDGKLALDTTRINNGRRIEPDGKPRRVVTSWFQHMMSMVLSAVGF